MADDRYLLQAITAELDVEAPKQVEKNMKQANESYSLPRDLADLFKSGGKTLGRIAGLLSVAAVLFAGRSWGVLLNTALELVGLVSDTVFIMFQPILIPLLEGMQGIGQILQKLVAEREEHGELTSGNVTSVLGLLTAELIETAGEAVSGLAKIGSRIVEGMTRILTGEGLEMQALRQQWEDVKAAAADFWEQVKDYVSANFQIFMMIATNKEFQQAVKQAFLNIFSSLKSAFSESFDYIERLATTTLTWDSISSLATKTMDVVETLVDKATEFFTAIVRGFVEWIMDTPLGDLVHGMITMMDAIDWMYVPRHLDPIAAKHATEEKLGQIDIV